MKHMTLKEITFACDGIYYGDPSFYHKSVSSVVRDDRDVQKDSLFVALRGTRVDGHTIIPKAIKAGALCALSEEMLEEATFPYILVPCCITALKDLATHYRKQMNIKVVGITGSVGKTSTKEVIASVLSERFSVLKTEGNYNNEIGLPLTIFRIREEHEIAVLEMGINNFGDMSYLAQMARPDICVFTNIGVAHIEQLKTRDGILKEKTAMLYYMNPEGTIILNGDDDKLITVKPANQISPTYYGLDEKWPYYATQIQDKGLRGTTATFHTSTSTFHAHISIPGKHMIYNALAALGVAYVFDMKDEDIRKGIEALRPLPGRNNLIETDTYTVIDDCYNANPVSVKAALSVLAKPNLTYGEDCIDPQIPATAKRTVAILGDMAELGLKAKEMHREIGETVVQLQIDVLIAIGTLAKEMVRGTNECIPQQDNTSVYHFNTKADFLAHQQNLLAKGDIILVKASNSQGFSEIVARLTGEI